MWVICAPCVSSLGVGVSVSRDVAECQRVLDSAGRKHPMHAYGPQLPAGACGADSKSACARGHLDGKSTSSSHPRSFRS